MVAVHLVAPGLSHTLWKQSEAEAYESARLAERLGFAVEVQRWEREPNGRLRRADAVKH